MAYSQKKQIKSRRQLESEERAKLSPQDLLEIRLSDEPAREICKRYSVGHRTINWVRFSNCWTNRD